MDIKIAHSTLTKFLDTNATPKQIASAMTACGPSIDRLHSINDDFQYEIEVITNRVDSLSAIGLGREAAAILPRFGFTAKSINPIPNHTLKSASSQLPLTIKIQDSKLASQVTAVVVESVNVKESPNWLKHELELAGERSINNLVDITNYVTRTHGHPVHFFDYEQIKDHLMIVRESRPDEKVTTLDGQSHTLTGGDIVIEDGSEKLIDLCGIMGGASSQITDKTKIIVIFILTYNHLKIRKTSLKYQTRTLAAQIFEKRPDPHSASSVLNACLHHLQVLSGGCIANHIHFDYTDTKENIISLKKSLIEKTLGIKVTLSEVTTILKHLGFTSTLKGAQTLQVTVPSWRQHDITIPQDLIEEFARVYGYHLIPPTLPKTDVAPIKAQETISWEVIVKNYLAQSGFHEVYNYSLVNEALYRQAKMPLDPAIKVLNPLSSDYTHLRRSLIPGLIQNFSRNVSRINQVNIFELSNIYQISNENVLPNELPVLCILQSNQSYQKAKGQVERLFKYLKITNLRYETLNDSETVFKTNQAVCIYHQEDLIGVFGKIKEDVLRSFVVNSDSVYLANLDFSLISNLANRHHIFKPIPTTNILIEDITIKSNLLVDELIRVLEKIDPLIINVKYQSTYHDSHTFSLTFNNPKKDLVKEDIFETKKIILAKLSV